jgi:hypothetical protein
MRKPRQHLFDALDPWPLGQIWPRDHDDGNAKLARGVNLGARAVSAGIAGNQPHDAARLHQRAIALEREGTPRDDQFGVRQGHGAIGRVDKSERVSVLWLCREGHDVLAADCEKDSGALFGQCGDGCSEITHLDPDIAGHLAPRRSLQRKQQCARGGAGFNRMAAHLSRERMRGVDHMRDALTLDVVGKSVGTAKAADSHRQRVSQRNLGATRVGIDRVDARAKKRVREAIGVARSAQNEGADHG